MISTTFKDRFEEFADVTFSEPNALYPLESSRPAISEDNWLNALSDIDKQVAEERKELLGGLTKAFNILSEVNRLIGYKQSNDKLMSELECLISKYSEGK